MSLALDAIYALVAFGTAPWWMRKTRGGWPERFGRIEPLPPPPPGKPRLLIHAVSVGETNLTRPLVDRLLADVDLVISSTTDTGIARARELYGSRCHVVRYPLDASWAVRRFVDAVRPDAVALVELELWPHFLTRCRRRGIPVSVINGRLSDRSFGRYRAGRAFIGKYFRQLVFAAVQDSTYAERFTTMGVAPERCHVVGSLKWDSADVTDRVAGAEELASELGIDRSRPLIVAGSTAPGEDELLHSAAPPGVQLLCAPRRPEHFDRAAGALPGCVRRSTRRPAPPGTDRYLLDSLGELRKAYALADVVVIGRSFGKLFGSDPMEAAALGKPVVIGPAVANFRSVVRAMLNDDAIVQTTPAELGATLGALLDDAPRRRALAGNARRCVLRHQGSTDRHAALILNMLGRAEATAPAEVPQEVPV